MNYLETKNKEKEIVKSECQLLLSRWERESLTSENFEYPNKAQEIIGEAANLNHPIPIVSPICANYETHSSNGKKRPTIHNEMVWNDRGLRAGAVLLHEEIPHRLRDLSKLGVSIQYLILVVDNATNPMLHGPLNPDYVKYKDDLKYYINHVVDKNVATMQSLVQDGLNSYNINHSAISVKTVRLSKIVDPKVQRNSHNFYDDWDRWNNHLESLYYSDTQNNQWAGLIRNAINKDGRYFKEAWGYTSENEIRDWVINKNFAITAAVGDWIHKTHELVFDQKHLNKGKVIILDTIPGPRNPGHKEFYAYNLDNPDGTPREKTPILRPFHNLVLLSQPAVNVPYLSKSLSQIQEELNDSGKF